MKKLTLKEAQARLDAYWPVGYYTLLEFEASGKPCKVQCNKCMTIKEYSQFCNIKNPLLGIKEC